jgi:hypothetical protein
MKLYLAAFALASLPSVTLAFTAARQSPVPRVALHAATLDGAPVREAPGAGYEPAWEDRPGLSPGEFMKSDMSKPDRSGMWECPLTRWDSEG